MLVVFYHRVDDIIGHSVFDGVGVGGYFLGYVLSGIKLQSRLCANPFPATAVGKDTVHPSLQVPSGDNSFPVHDLGILYCQGLVPGIGDEGRGDRLAVHQSSLLGSDPDAFLLVETDGVHVCDKLLSVQHFELVVMGHVSIAEVIGPIADIGCDVQQVALNGHIVQAVVLGHDGFPLLHLYVVVEQDRVVLAVPDLEKAVSERIEYRR